MKHIRIITDSTEKTRKLGAKFSELLTIGDVVGFIGDLGGGKTTFTQGILQGLNYDGAVTSPTFTLVHEYPTNPKIYHLDCFRIKVHSDYASIGIDDFLLDDAILLIEWADKIIDYFILRTWQVVFNFVEGSDQRRELVFHHNKPAEMQRLADHFRDFIMETQ
ncbi:tRNA (adenosine(37)-N6)-threonylcarbamoyltransferase complex ATPase subunit type 1 TsaE [bacterium]|nr:tRNA (adenosine(37)-N6)-threonylcarbamoyltransferase complex ATPase subunit type 1 TsaE [bacterium]MBU1652108.1 tRNA (adenosine(37)-N6)-threonylcarbamoyltransferase complex ATPase subunit type 1 TsaE [bacterium]MBU1881051.1 tRNA (adenosine(37)-N6)-threonylcarbamoyltransferase complex ATPase subunit type 1 TsaE [bacterium]